MSSLWQTYEFVWTFHISIIISTDSASYFLKMSMLISLVGIFTQSIRMGVDRVTFLRKGPMRGQYVFLTAKNVLFMGVFYFSYYFHRLSLLLP